MDLTSLIQQIFGSISGLVPAPFLDIINQIT